MALFKHADKVRQFLSVAFDRRYRPGFSAPHDGLYAWVNCSMEIFSKGVLPLPTARQRAHHAWCRAVEWQLLVSTSTGSASACC